MADKRQTNPQEKTVQHMAIKVRLHPTPEQAELMEKTFGCCRYLWNRILSDQEEFYAATGVHFLPTPARYKKEAPFLKEVDSMALVSVHQNLRQAFLNFFSHPESFKHPVYKRKKGGRDSYTIYRSTTSKGLYLTQEGIRMPKMGIVPAKFHRRPKEDWVLKCATVSRTPAGNYDCSLKFDSPEKIPEAPPPTPETTLGLNFSMAHFYVDSSGHQADPPLWISRCQDKIAAMQRRLDRMVPGSNNYQEQLLKLQKLHEHIANQRKDFLHKESRRIANAWDGVCVLDSDLKEMAKTLPLGNVMEKGFGEFRRQLQYKLERQGKAFIKVARFTPTARTCHCCGNENPDLTLKERTWVCPACGEVISREVNAARNLRDQGLAQYQQKAEKKRSA